MTLTFYTHADIYIKIITTQAGLNYFTHSPLNCDLQGFLTYLRSSLFVFSHNFQCCVGIFIIHQWFHDIFFFSIFSAVFTWTNLLVVVAELDGPETEALDLVPLITNTVLEEHHLIVGIVVIADPGTVPINSRGEKQRMHLRDGFLADQLDPIYVAYNM